ncbi:MAG: hypothetical protein RBS29_04085 [Bacteroidales bacterium]|jgi:ligand-binding sensor domain-containing protein|nr:hypothetical protein [Bacteroidales bacterium]
MQTKLVQIFLSFVFLFSFIPSFSQIPIGSFREHLPYRSFYHVAVSPDKVYAATLKNLMILDKNDNYAKTTLSKIDGLSEIGIENLQYLPQSDLLLIVYQNSNLDLYRNNEIVNISDIKNKQIIGSKKINSVLEDGNLLYLATGFGIVVIDLNRFLIKDTWFTSLDGENYQIFGITKFQNKFYVASEKGVYSIHSEDIRIPDFSSWSFEADLDTFHYNYIETFGDYLIVNKKRDQQDSIFAFKESQWLYQPQMATIQLMNIQKQDHELAVLDWDQLHLFDSNLNKISTYKWLDGSQLSLGKDVAFDGTDIMWIADQYHGLVYYNRPLTYPVFYVMEGPATELVESMDCKNGILVAVPGSRAEWGFNYIPPSLSVFAQNQWSYITTPFYQFSQANDFTNVILHPKKESELYIASWSGGLFKLENGIITKRWDAYNAPLQPIYASPSDTTKYVFLSGLAFDKYDNLWITNSKVSQPLKVLKKDSTWQSFSLSPYIPGVEDNVAEHILVDSRNYKWITFPRQNKLIVYDDNRTIDDKSDDQIAQIDLNSSANITTEHINCIVEDLNGNIWIGCDRSIKVVYNPSSVFTKQLYAKNILLEQNGYVQNLFEFEMVNAIVVDGANRKWVGTSKAGVFLVSDNGTEQLLHFDEDNSPLLSNQIISLSIDQESGEVFFGTTAGIMSYRGTATEGAKNYNDYLVFPNPVRENYTGNITVKGLMENSFCKVVDGSGFLLYQGYANGGTFVWNGKDFNGNRPATGVYFIFASSDTGEERQVAKLLFVK